MIYNQRKLKELDNTKLRRNEIGKKYKKEEDNFKEFFMSMYECPYHVQSSWNVTLRRLRVETIRLGIYYIIKRRNFEKYDTRDNKNWRKMREKREKCGSDCHHPIGRLTLSARRFGDDFVLNGRRFLRRRWRRRRPSVAVLTAVAAPATAAASAAAVVRLVAGDYEITFQFQRLDRTEHRRRRLGRCCRLLLLLLLLVLLGGVMVGRQFGRSRCRRHGGRVGRYQLRRWIVTRRQRERRPPQTNCQKRQTELTARCQVTPPGWSVVRPTQPSENWLLQKYNGIHSSFCLHLGREFLNLRKEGWWCGWCPK